MKNIGIIISLMVIVLLSSCKKDEEKMFVDGTYYAEASEFSHGWKAYIEAKIADDKLESVDFDYVDEDGGLKSETTAETYPMDPHPTVWLPEYEASLMAADLTSFTEVDAVSGATSAWENCNALMTAILEAAKTGDTSTQVVVME